MFGPSREIESFDRQFSSGLETKVEVPLLLSRNQGKTEVVVLVEGLVKFPLAKDSSSVPSSFLR